MVNDDSPAKWTHVGHSARLRGQDGRHGRDVHGSLVAGQDASIGKPLVGGVLDLGGNDRLEEVDDGGLSGVLVEVAIAVGAAVGSDIVGGETGSVLGELYSMLASCFALHHGSSSSPCCQKVQSVRQHISHLQVVIARTG